MAVQHLLVDDIDGKGLKSGDLNYSYKSLIYPISWEHSKNGSQFLLSFCYLLPFQIQVGVGVGKCYNAITCLKESEDILEQSQFQVKYLMWENVHSGAFIIICE